MIHVLIGIGIHVLNGIGMVKIVTELNTCKYNFYIICYVI